MGQIRDWGAMKELCARLLKERTGEDVETWNQRIRRAELKDEGELRAWLAAKGITGYAQKLLVMERFGYPDFLLASADELVDGQYADRLQLRPIYDAIIGRPPDLAKSLSRHARHTSRSSRRDEHSRGYNLQPKAASI